MIKMTVWPYLYIPIYGETTAHIKEISSRTPATPEAGPGWNQESGNPFSSLTWRATTQQPEPSPAVSKSTH